MDSIKAEEEKKLNKIHEKKKKNLATPSTSGTQKFAAMDICLENMLKGVREQLSN